MARSAVKLFPGHNKLWYPCLTQINTPLPPTLMQATHNLYKYHRRHTHRERVYKNRKTTCQRGKGAWREWKADKRIVESGYDHNISPMYEIVREMQLLKFPQKKNFVFKV